MWGQTSVSWAEDKLKSKNATIDPFEVNLSYVENGLGGFKYKYKDAPIFSTLIKNPQFKKQFVLTYFDLMNTEFSAKAVESSLTALGIADNVVWNQFYKDRPEYATANIVKAMNLSGDLCDVEITCNDGGTVKINYSDDKESITGIYPVEYNISVTALPKDGYRFAGWEGYVSSDEESLSITLSEEGIALRAIFEKEGDS